MCCQRQRRRGHQGAGRVRVRIYERPLQCVQLAVQVHQLGSQRLYVVVRQPLLPQLRQRLGALRPSELELAATCHASRQSVEAGGVRSALQRACACVAMQLSRQMLYSGDC